MKFSALPEMTSNIVNEACWKLHDKLPECPAIVFNHLKPAFYEGLKVVLEGMLAQSALTQATASEQGEPYTMIDMGHGKWEVGAGTNAGLPCIAFGKNGSGVVGELITPEPRQMSVEETHAVITFANAQGFAVLQEKMDDVRALHFSTAQPAPAKAEDSHEWWCPDVCPITDLPFFMWIEHHKTGQMVPTYGGPYDSYTIPVREDDGSYCCERYDHDRGGWLVDELQDVGLRLVSDQAYVSDEPPASQSPAPAARPMTDDQVWHNEALMSANGIVGFQMDALMRIVRAVEAHHRIGSQPTAPAVHAEFTDALRETAERSKAAPPGTLVQINPTVSAEFAKFQRGEPSAFDALSAAPAAVPEDVAKNAARYVWLRDASVPPHNFYLSVPAEFDGLEYRPSEVDNYIDAAMLASAPTSTSTKGGAV